MEPSPGRVVMYYPKGSLKPWPAIVVEVFEKNGKTSCDLHPFPTRGNGVVALLEGVPFSEKPGERETCSFPVILSSVPPAPLSELAK